MKYVVDVSNITLHDWEDAIPAACGHITIHPIRHHNELYVLDNMTEQDVMILTLIGFMFKLDVITDTNYLPDGERALTDYLVETRDGYMIMRMFYSKIPYSK